ncbi:hypothetical protein [Anaerosphaera multitolerans]|nr:hypothetical protein [Anaerosphaera multitolerans]
MISFKEMKSQWRTFLIGFVSILGMVTALFTFSFLFDGLEYVVAAIAALSGGTISVVMIQDAALASGLISVAALPVLIAAFQGLIGFPLSSILLRKEAVNIKAKLKAGDISIKTYLEMSKENSKNITKKSKFKLPKMFQTTPGTLCAVGIVVLIATYLSSLTNGVINTFIIALILGTGLRSIGVFKPNILGGIDAFGIMMLAIMLIIFGPLSTLAIDDLLGLIFPLMISFVIGITGCILFASITGKFMGYSLPMSISIGLTSLYGFPGTMVLSQEAARSAGDSDLEVKAIEGEILPKMIVAGFSTVTITSVFITSILVNFIY